MQAMKGLFSLRHCTENTRQHEIKPQSQFVWRCQPGDPCPGMVPLKKTRGTRKSRYQLPQTASWCAKSMLWGVSKDFCTWKVFCSPILNCSHGKVGMPWFEAKLSDLAVSSTGTMGKKQVSNTHGVLECECSYPLIVPSTGVSAYDSLLGWVEPARGRMR